MFLFSIKRESGRSDFGVVRYKNYVLSLDEMDEALRSVRLQ